MGSEYRGIEVDDLKLLRLLCRMANMDQAGVQKAVLVCEVGRTPIIYVQSLLQPVDEQLAKEFLDANEGVTSEVVECIHIDTTTMQNERLI
jgi:hypothetical protein